MQGSPELDDFGVLGFLRLLLTDLKYSEAAIECLGDDLTTVPAWNLTWTIEHDIEEAGTVVSEEDLIDPFIQD